MVPARPAVSLHNSLWTRADDVPKLEISPTPVIATLFFMDLHKPDEGLAASIKEELFPPKA